jgi:hypothetical protein
MNTFSRIVDLPSRIDDRVSQGLIIGCDKRLRHMFCTIYINPNIIHANHGEQQPFWVPFTSLYFT